MTTIRVQYTCHKCRTIAREVDVEVRGPAEDVVAWMNRSVILALGKDHQQYSPYCTTGILSDIKIPIPKGENARIGDPPSPPEH